MSNSKTVAAIDIGTNTILMAIGEYKDNGDFSIIRDELRFARLGKDVNATKYISEERTAIALEILSDYKELCNVYGVDEIRAVATSAMRDATNSEIVKGKLESVLQTTIEVVGGEREAYLSFLGTVPNENGAIVVDIGGGSTEIVVGRERSILFSQSLNIGAVRISERFFSTSPPTHEEVILATSLIEQSISQLPTFDFPIYCVAGTPVTLACISQGIETYQPEKINGYVLSSLAINVILRQLITSSTEEITLMNSVAAERADILPAGTLILSSVLRHFSKNNCIVSTGGLRFGLIKESKL